MCGIAGIFEYERRDRVDPDALSAMLDTIKHRGPDDRGILVAGEFAMGMQRLSIIDVDGGKQPILNEARTVAVVCNGEIYNYLELRERLRSRGHIQSSNSDSEVIAHLYEEEGDHCIDDLRGMFGFAVWDKARERLLLARDRLGIKPLYYAIQNGALLFASEIKALLAHPGVDASLNLQGLGDYLSLKYVPAPETMFTGIHALPPGHLLTCDANGVRISRYWDLCFAERGSKRMSEDEYAEQLEALLRESVKLHLMSDVAFGAFLSGGVDSSLIVALMQKFMNVPVKTFSVGFQGGGAEAFSELPYARLVAKQVGADHHEVFVRPLDFMELAQDVVWHLDQPIADNACVANYMVSRLASQHVKMVLTGEGGDELFAGYARYAGERLASTFRFVPLSVKRAFLDALSAIPGLRRPKAALLALSQPDELTRLTTWFPLFSRVRKPSLLREEIFYELADPYAEKLFAMQLGRCGTKDWLGRMLYIDTKLWLPDDLLARGDKTAMAASLEARVPLLDHKLVEFAATVPSNLKVKGLARKYLLRKVARKFLPSEIIDRKKAGFPMPFSLWFRNECREFVRDLLSWETVARRGLFRPDYVQMLLDEHDSGVADHGNLIWGLLSVELWQRSFFDSRVHSAEPAGASALLN